LNDIQAHIAGWMMGWRTSGFLAISSGAVNAEPKK